MSVDEHIDMWAFDGSFELKTLDDKGRFEGLAVPFGDPDLSEKRDVFTAETNFGRSLKSGADLLYFHGLPYVGTEPNPLSEAILGDAELKTTDAGVWMTGQMRLRDEYELKVWELVKAKKLGLSTGTAAHRVRREKRQDGTHAIKTWPIVEVSLTPTPAHPRTSVYALKTLLPESEPPESVGFVDALKAAVSALEWASGQRELNAVKADAIKSLTEAVRAYRDSRIDPDRLKAGLELLDKLNTRFQGK